MTVAVAVSCEMAPQVTSTVPFFLLGAGELHRAEADPADLEVGAGERRSSAEEVLPPSSETLRMSGAGVKSGLMPSTMLYGVWPECKVYG